MGSPIGGEKRFFKGALAAEEQRLLIADGRHDDAGNAEAARRPAVGQQLIAQHRTGVLLRAERAERVQITGGGGLFCIGVLSMSQSRARIRFLCRNSGVMSAARANMKSGVSVRFTGNSCFGLISYAILPYSAPLFKRVVVGNPQKMKKSQKRVDKAGMRCYD